MDAATIASLLESFARLSTNALDSLAISERADMEEAEVRHARDRAVSLEYLAMIDAELARRNVASERSET